MKPTHLLLVEKDPDCRRLLRREWPGAELLGDITQLTREKIKDYTEGRGYWSSGSRR